MIAGLQLIDIATNMMVERQEEKEEKILSIDLYCSSSAPISWNHLFDFHSIKSSLDQIYNLIISCQARESNLMRQS